MRYLSTTNQTERSIISRREISWSKLKIYQSNSVLKSRLKICTLMREKRCWPKIQCKDSHTFPSYFSCLTSMMFFQRKTKSIMITPCMASIINKYREFSTEKILLTCASILLLLQSTVLKKKIMIIKRYQNSRVIKCRNRSIKSVITIQHTILGKTRKIIETLLT